MRPKCHIRCCGESHEIIDGHRNQREEHTVTELTERSTAGSARRRALKIRHQDVESLRVFWPDSQRFLCQFVSFP
jgi:hypothetical protein